MPTPSPKETRQDWMSRCIPMLRDEGKPQDQAIAVCTSMWKKHEQEKDQLDEEAMERIGAMRPRPGEDEAHWMTRCTVVGDEATCRALWTQRATDEADGDDDEKKKKKLPWE